MNCVSVSVSARECGCGVIVSVSGCESDCGVIVSVSVGVV